LLVRVLGADQPISLAGGAQYLKTRIALDPAAGVPLNNDRMNLL